MLYRVLSLLIITVTIGFGQSRMDSLYKSTESLGTITLGEGLGNLPKLAFEATIQNKFYASIGKAKRWSFNLDPRVNLRMRRDEYSYPVVNPSYHVNGELMYKLHSDDNELRFISGRAGHHSNGQEAFFYDWVNDVIDYENGSFMTQFLTFAYSDLRFRNRFNMDLLVRRRIELEVHPNVFRNPYLDEMYDDIRLNGTYVARKEKSGKKPSMMLELEGTILCEEISLNRIANASAFIFRSRYSLQPIPKSEFWLYVEYYHGQDYYNLYFNNVLDVLRVGVLVVPNKAPLFN